MFLLFIEQKILLMKNENEASVPEFSSWTFTKKAVYNKFQNSYPCYFFLFFFNGFNFNMKTN